VGHDPQRGGVFTEVAWNGLVVAHDGNDVDADDDPVRPVLRFLASFGYIAIDDIAEARGWLTRPSCWRRRRPPRRVRRVIAIVEALERAAGA